MKIILGITGSVACYKAAELARALIRAEASVHPVMTRAATEMLGPKLLHALTGNPPVTDLFADRSPYAHIEAREGAQALVVAPATANIIAKAAAGIADDALSTVISTSTGIPVLFAPAMNVRMYEHPANRRNVETLGSFGYRIIEAGEGDLACGAEGRGRLAPVERILEETLAAAWPVKDLTGLNVLVTGGGTREPLDPVRFLGNPSSGKMGYELARAAARRGAAVSLVTAGDYEAYLPASVSVTRVTTAYEMLEAVRKLAPQADVAIMPAAVADFKPKSYSAEKIKKDQFPTAVELEATPDILAKLGAGKGDKLLVGFAAETADLEVEARRKLLEKNVDIIVANRVGGAAGFGSDLIDAAILSPDETERVGVVTKAKLADRVLDKVARAARR